MSNTERLENAKREFRNQFQNEGWHRFVWKQIDGLLESILTSPKQPVQDIQPAKFTDAERENKISEILAPDPIEAEAICGAVIHVGFEGNTTCANPKVGCIMHDPVARAKRMAEFEESQKPVRKSAEDKEWNYDRRKDPDPEISKSSPPIRADWEKEMSALIDRYSWQYTDRARKIIELAREVEAKARVAVIEQARVLFRNEGEAWRGKEIRMLLDRLTNEHERE